MGSGPCSDTWGPRTRSHVAVTRCCQLFSLPVPEESAGEREETGENRTGGRERREEGGEIRSEEVGIHGEPAPVRFPIAFSVAGEPHCRRLPPSLFVGAFILFWGGDCRFFLVVFGMEESSLPSRSPIPRPFDGHLDL
jgi:hypothetical protein